MSLIRHLKKHGAINDDEGGLAVAIGGAPVYVDVTDALMHSNVRPPNREELEALPPFADAWIECRDIGADPDRPGSGLTAGCRVLAGSWTTGVDGNHPAFLKGNWTSGADGRLPVLEIFVFAGIQNDYRGTARYDGHVLLPLDETGRVITTDSKLADATKRLIGIYIEELHAEDESLDLHYLQWRQGDVIRFENHVYPDSDSTVGIFHAMCLAVLQTYDLLNCKNVAVEPTTDLATLEHAFRRGRKAKGLRWHRLVVVKPSVREAHGIRVPRGSGEPILRQHLQRGHFKTFTAEAPLFGKYTGRFWWSPHVRGSKELGVVLKDYEVHTDSDGSPA